MGDTSSTATPARISRAGAIRAAVAGAQAHEAGRKVTDCPHSSDSIVGRFYARQWRRGYGAAAAKTA